MEELTKEEKLKAWEKLCNNFTREYPYVRFTGLCHCIHSMHGGGLLLNSEAYYLRDEIKEDVKENGIDSKWLFRMIQYEPRLEYLKNKIKKYS